MTYETFCRRVNNLLRRSGAKARFFREDGKHIARCTDGVTVIGNSECFRVLIRWGSGHTAYANL